ncbi:unnamed protein product [Lactuca virosa]|uniref:Tetrahydrofolate dehydrogenase/cyclohydrolase NAD(P)-binding domain-containing protein n=1 Tax=Lactuca virosa TaxID=75947 RepID=A0AAU9PS96_9ASTR|nr:unnamed protein product [Lactuca virosa]
MRVGGTLISQVVVSMALLVDHKATIIDGKAIAQTIRSEIASEVSTLMEKYGKEDVTVIVVHPRTEDPESMIHEADIVIAAIGQPMMVG